MKFKNEFFMDNFVKRFAKVLEKKISLFANLHIFS